MDTELATGETPAQTLPIVRDHNGHFVKGNVANPRGRPPVDPSLHGTTKLTQVKRKLEIAVRENISEERIHRIIVKLCEMAEQGNVRAAKLILDKVVSNAGGVETEGQGDNGRTVIFKIQNATFAAVKQASQEPAVDVEVIEVQAVDSSPPSKSC